MLCTIGHLVVMFNVAGASARAQHRIPVHRIPVLPAWNSFIGLQAQGTVGAFYSSVDGIAYLGLHLHGLRNPHRLLRS